MTDTALICFVSLSLSLFGTPIREETAFRVIWAGLRLYGELTRDHARGTRAHGVDRSRGSIEIYKRGCTCWMVIEEGCH